MILITTIQTPRYMLLDSVPLNFNLRPIQRKILEEIDQSLQSGYKNIILCAPTGVGKSLVGVTAAEHLGTSFVITASKNLQDQYKKDFGFLKSVKGKSNFECHLIMADKHMDDAAYARRSGMTCEKGQCTTKKMVDGKTQYSTCRFKPTIQDVDDNKYDPTTCPYYLQKYHGLLAPHSLWNYASFFQIMKFGRKLFKQYLDRRLAVFDEAHTIEDQIVGFVGFDIRPRHLEDAKIDINRYDLESTDDILSIITDIASHYAERIRDIEDSSDPEHHPEYVQLARLQSNYEAAAQARIDITATPENFVVNRPDLDVEGNIRMVSVKPVDVSKFAGEFFDADHNLFMSATIDRESFCESMGLASSDVAMIDTEESPFPLEHRSVRMLRVRYLNYKSTPEDEAAIYAAIDQIMDEYPDKRGLILTSSVAKCYQILKGVSDGNRGRIRICHSSNPNGKTQDDIIQEHAKDSTGVILSSSLWEGVDLKDDLSRFQIIAKVPYPNYADSHTRAKMKMFPRWYTARTLTKLLQGLGRSVRSEDDWAHTYILDAASDRLFRSRDMIPKSYHDVLGMRPTQ